MQSRLLVGRFPAGEELNEADEAKVERSGFAWRRGWVGSGDAESCETLFGVALWILFNCSLGGIS